MTTPLWKRIIARILEALLAIIFISPLVWVIICSFSPQAGSAQSKGWGVANYLTATPMRRKNVSMSLPIRATTGAGVCT